MTSVPKPVRRIEIYDTTLRDGAQGEGVAFSLVDKLKIAGQLDALGVDYIEGGYPLSNPKDVAFFAEAAKIKFRHAKLGAFGMTRRKDSRAQDDPGMVALVESGAPLITLVGKSWDLHVEQVLRVTAEENLAMIGDSVAFCRAAGREVFYDAEHFFDGYRAHAAYALATLRAAWEAGAQRLILCDTNGGSLPAWIGQVVAAVQASLGTGTPALLLGIHTHNDAGLAVANALAAVDAGAVQVQGTINGIGERCGNVDLIAVVANLRLKMGCACLAAEGNDGLTRLTETSRFVYEMANLNLLPNQPYVGSAAFAHKGGMHVHAVQRLARSYEHVPPESVGNSRRILISELSGVSAVSATLGNKFKITDNKKVQKQLVERVAELENQGYQFEAAQASFELLLHDLLGSRPTFWELQHYRCVIVKHGDQAPTTEASVKLSLGPRHGPGYFEHHVAEGDGPVNALDAALRKCLRGRYPQIDRVHLCDYKVRVVNATAESAAKVRVIVEFAVTRDPAADGPAAPYFSTIGVSENIVDASWQALSDAFAYHLIETGGPRPGVARL